MIKKYNRRFFTYLVMTAFILLAALGMGKTVNAADLDTVYAVGKSTSASQITIQWNKVSGAYGYIIYRKVGAKGKWVRLARVINTWSEFQDKNVESGRIYYYAVRAFVVVNGVDVQGKYSSVGLAANPAAPKITTKLVSGKIKLTWKDGVGESGYRIYRRIKGYSWNVGNLIATVSGNTVSYTDTKASPGITYEYCVRAYKILKNIEYESAKSNVVTASCSRLGSLGTNLMAGTVQSAIVETECASSSPKRVVLRWNQVIGSQGYTVYRKIPGQKWAAIKNINGASVRTYTDSAVSAGTVYEYAVRAFVKSGGQTVRSQYRSEKIATRPAAPAKFWAGVSGGKVLMTWGAAANTDGYLIYRKNGSGTYQQIAKVNANIVTYIDTAVGTGHAYTYYVRAYKMAGNVMYYSAESNAESVSISATTLTQAQKEVLKNVLYAVESGGQVYGNQDYAAFAGVGANVSSEVAITIGAGQWYATEAKRLLMLIQSTYPVQFKKIDSKGLIAQDLVNANWSRYGVSASSEKGKIIIALINSSYGRVCQDFLMIQQIEEYEVLIRNTYGVTDPGAMCECINIIHQGGSGSLRRILNKTQKPYTLDTIYTALQSDRADGFNNQVGDYVTRQACVYKWLKQYLYS